MIGLNRSGVLSQWSIVCKRFSCEKHKIRCTKRAYYLLLFSSFADVEIFRSRTSVQRTRFVSEYAGNPRGYRVTVGACSTCCGRRATRQRVNKLRGRRLNCRRSRTSDGQLKKFEHRLIWLPSGRLHCGKFPSKPAPHHSSHNPRWSRTLEQKWWVRRHDTACMCM